MSTFEGISTKVASIDVYFLTFKRRERGSEARPDINATPFRKERASRVNQEKYYPRRARVGTHESWLHLFHLLGGLVPSLPPIFLPESEDVSLQSPKFPHQHHFANRLYIKTDRNSHQCGILYCSALAICATV